MAGYSTYPTAFDSTFPGYPYVDNTEYLDQTQANAWVSAIQNLETTIGYGLVGNPASPLWSAAYNTTYSSLTARLVATEALVNNGVKINSSGGVIQSVGVTNQAGASGLAADAAHVHAGSASPSSYVPIGGTIIWPGPSGTFPQNFFQCNGQLVSTTTYNALYVALGSGSVYGVSGGSFFLPNLNDRFPLGVNAVAATVGATGGSRTISTNQMPAHNHSVSVSLNDPGHRHESQLDEVPGDEGVYTSGGSTLSLQLQTAGPPNAVSYSPTGGGQLHWKSATTGIGVSGASSGNTGAGFNYDQPYLGVYFLIRAL